MEKSIENIHVLYAQGYSYNQIRDALGYSKGTISYHLGAGVKEKTTTRMAMNRKSVEEFIQNFKESHPCHDCGNFYPYYVMQFDHLPQYEKLFTIAQWHNYTQDVKVVIAEMQKCDLVCGNCHTVRSHLRRLEEKGMLLDEEY
jgi:DNA-binding CsgD family transcriptional regulator